MEKTTSLANGSSFAFKIFLIWTFALVARPQDYIPLLLHLRPALLLTLIMLIVSLTGSERYSAAGIFQNKIGRNYTLLYMLMVIGIIFASHRGIAFNWVIKIYIMNMIYFYMAAYYLNSLKRIRKYIYLLVLSILSYGLSVMMSGQLLEGRLFFGTMYDPNDIALFMVGLFPMAIIFFRKKYKPSTRIAAGTVLFIAPAVTLLTASRGGFLSLAVILTILLLTKIARIKKTYKIIFVCILATILLVYGSKINKERIDTLFNMDDDYNITSDTGRLAVWDTAFKLIEQNPITGVGANCFGRAFGYTRAAEGRAPTWMAVHNAYLQIWSEIGYPGFVLFLILIFRSIISYWKTSRVHSESSEDDDYVLIGGCVLLGFAGHLVGVFFLSQAYGLQFTLFFVLAAAFERLWVKSGTEVTMRYDAAKKKITATSLQPVENNKPLCTTK